MSQACKLALSYDMQVDVRALKQTLWQCIGDEADNQQSEEQDNGLAFSQVLSQLSTENAVGNVEDLSVHLCFICLLHLANENGLRITGADTLDQVQIWDVPSASTIWSLDKASGTRSMRAWNMGIDIWHNWSSQSTIQKSCSYQAL